MLILKKLRSPFSSFFLLSIGLPLLFFSCIEKKMTLQEAKKVSVSMKQHSFVPPPRTVEDVIKLLNQPGSFNDRITARMTKKANAEPPKTDNPKKLAEFYRDRGVSAREIGRSNQELKDARLALFYARKAKDMIPKGFSYLLTNAGVAEVRLGNFKKGQEYFKEGITVYPDVSLYHLLASSLFMSGDFKEGIKTVNEGLAFCKKFEQNNRLKIDARGRSARYFANKNRLKGLFYEYSGKYKQAEPYWRDFIRYMEFSKDKKPAIYILSRYHLTNNLKLQGRFLEAEAQIRETLKLSIGLSGKYSNITATVLRQLGEILLLQGRLEDAKQIFKASIVSMKKAGVSDDSIAGVDAKLKLGEVFFTQNKIPMALKQFLSIKKNLKQNSYFYHQNITQNHNVILCFILSGYLDQAMESILYFSKKIQPYIGGNDYRTAEITGFRGMIYAERKNIQRALKDFSKATAVLFKEKGDEDDFIKIFRRQLIVESYMDLLFRIKKHGREEEFSLDASKKIFTLCEQLNNSVVQGALGASGARALAVDTELADLVRKEQDASKQIAAMKRALINSISAGSGQTGKNTLSDLNTSLNSLMKARQAILEEIEFRFPKYSDFINPHPKGFDHIRSALTPDEAMIVMYPVSDKIYLWSVSKTGETAFSAALILKAELTHLVQMLRKSLAPNPKVFDDIPKFKLNTAYALYAELFKPLEHVWEKAEDLLIVAPGPLGQIPFGVFPTVSTPIGNEKKLLYDNYRNVPWLIKQVSITRLPSVNSFLTLRQLPEPASDRLPFVGFGDPIFNSGQITDADKNPFRKRMAMRGGVLQVRGLRKVEKKNIHLTAKNTMTLGKLSRLPDTAEEILSIAGVMGTDKLSSVFLGKQASETNVKNINLSNAKVIAFASHGLVPGDLDGLTQPAIALTAPEVIGDFNEDGLLKMGEILKLKLNADWVVLSACNTGAAGGAGAEAVSGLGRSFFYAGTRALLVTMWAVESTSAKELTTGLFRYQNENPNLSRAKALQKSIVQLIDKKTLIYKGREVAAYAHPFFWAPFIVVGDGG